MTELPEPRRATRTRHARPTLTAVSLVMLVTLTACSTGSTTAGPSVGAAVGLSAEPSPTQPLLPESTSSAAVGTLAAGFPSDLLPLPADAEVLVSASEPLASSAILQVSLNLRTAMQPADLIQLYRAPLTAAGFVEVPGDAAGTVLAAQATFTRSGGDEILVMGVLDRDGVRTLTLGGRVKKPA